MFEASYASYTRAAELEPGSVRLLNDRALLLIYHLQRDWGLARDLLKDAIALGEAQLKDNPPTDAGELRDQQEALGDCYQNRGYYQEKQVKDLAAAKASYEKSLTFYPRRLRESTLHLVRVKRKLARAARRRSAGQGAAGKRETGK